MPAGLEFPDLRRNRTTLITAALRVQVDELGPDLSRLTGAFVIAASAVVPLVAGAIVLRRHDA